MSTPLDNLVACLLQCCSHDNAARQAAEAQLRSAGSTSGFGTALVAVALDQSRPEQARQLAAVYLKQFLKEFWRDGNSRFTQQEKTYARTHLLTGLRDPSRLMRTAFGLCVAKIAQEDWPEQWPDLFDHLLGALDSGDPVHVLGAVRCISLFCDWLDDVTIPRLAANLFPALTRIVSDDVSFGPQTRRYASSVIKTCVVLFSHMRGNPDMPAFAALAQGIQQWLGPLLNMLTPQSWQRQQVWHQQSIVSGRVMAEDPALCRGYGCQIESLQSMSVLVGELYKFLGPNEARRVFMTVWQFTEQLLPLYISQVISPPDSVGGNGGDGGDGGAGGAGGNGSEESSIYDDEGNGVGIDVLMVQIFEFLNAVAVVPHSSIRILLSQGMSQIVRTCVVVIQLTSDQLEQWESGKIDDSGDEDIGSLELGDLQARNVAAVLMYELMDSFTEEALAAVSSAFGWSVQTAEAARASGDSHWWKPLESAMLVAGIVSRAVQDQTSGSDGNAGGGEASAAASFCTSSVVATALALIKSPQHVPPVLWSRSMWVLGRFSWALTSEQGSECFTMGATTLSSHQSVPVRMASCRALLELHSHLINSSESRASLLMSAVQGTCNLLSSTSGDALPIVVGALSQFITHAGHDIAASVEPHLTPILVQIWSAHAANPHLCGSIVDVFQSIAVNSSALPGLQSRLLPTLCSLVSAHATNLPGVVEYALDLMAVIARGDATAGTELPASFVSMALPCVLQFMSVSDDNAGLTSGTACLSAIVYASKRTLQSMTLPRSSVTPVDSILSVVSRLLSPSFAETGAVRVGSLATQILTCFSESLSPETVQQLCQAMIVRLTTCRYGELKQSIVVFFARMIHRDVHAVMSMLNSMQVQGGADGQSKSGLLVLMHCWMSDQPTFVGRFDVKSTLLALSLVFQHYGGQCSQIMVDGDLVVNVNEGRRTRSQGRKAPEYESIPLPLKVIQLLLRAVDEPEDEYEDGDESELSGGVSGSGMSGSGMSSGIFAPAEDFEEFMLSDIGSTFMWDDEEEGEEQAESLDVLEDPLYQVDLQEHLLAFFKQRSAEEMNGIGSRLNHHDQQRLVAVGKMLSGVVPKR